MLGMFGQVTLPTATGSETFYDYSDAGGRYIAIGADQYNYVPNTPTVSSPTPSPSATVTPSTNYGNSTNIVPASTVVNANTANAVNVSAGVKSTNSLFDAILGLFSPAKDNKDINGNPIANANGTTTPNAENKTGFILDVENLYVNHKTAVLIGVGVVGAYFIFKKD